MAFRKYGNQIYNPYTVAMIAGGGGGPGNPLFRAVTGSFQTLIQYIAAEYGSWDPADFETIPVFAMPAIVGGKPRAISVPPSAPPLPPDDIG